MKVILHHRPTAGLRAHLEDISPPWLDVVFADPVDQLAFRGKLADADVLWHVLEPLGQADFAGAG
ncbi:MAG: hypothetical protein ACC631_00525, partial [Halocynthiibacter sp.]